MVTDETGQHDCHLQQGNTIAIAQEDNADLAPEPHDGNLEQHADGTTATSPNGTSVTDAGSDSDTDTADTVTETNTAAAAARLNTLDFSQPVTEYHQQQHPSIISNNGGSGGGSSGGSGGGSGSGRAGSSGGGNGNSSAGSYASTLAPKTSAKGYQYEPGTPAALKYKHPRQLFLDFLSAPGPYGSRIPTQAEVYKQIRQRIPAEHIGSVFLDGSRKRCLINFKSVELMTTHLNTEFRWSINGNEFANKLKFDGHEKTILMLDYVFDDVELDDIVAQFKHCGAPEVIDVMCQRHVPKGETFASGKVFVNVTHRPGWEPPTYIRLQVEEERLPYMVLRAGRNLTASADGTSDTDNISSQQHAKGTASLRRAAAAPPGTPVGRRTRSAALNGPLIGVVGGSLLHAVRTRKHLREALGNIRRETATTCPGGDVNTIGYQLGSASVQNDVKHVLVLAGTNDCAARVNNSTRENLRSLKATAEEKFPSATIHPIAVPPLLQPEITPSTVKLNLASRGRQHTAVEFASHSKNRQAMNSMIEEVFNTTPIILEVDEGNASHFHDHIHLSDNFWLNTGIPQLKQSMKQ